MTLRNDPVQHYEDRSRRGSHQAQGYCEKEIGQAGTVFRKHIQAAEELSRQEHERDRGYRRRDQAGNEYPRQGERRACGFKGEQRSAERGGHKSPEHPAQAREPHRSGAPPVHLESIGQPGAETPGGVRHGGFGSQATPRGQGDKGSDHYAGRVAVVEPAGPSEFLHQLGKDATVVPEDLEQHADDEPRDGADDHSQDGLPDVTRALHGLPDQVGHLPRGPDESEGDDGAGEAHQGGEEQQLEVRTWLDSLVIHSRRYSLPSGRTLHRGPTGRPFGANSPASGVGYFRP